MANDTSFREADILSQEFVCQETESQSSQVTVGTKSERCPSAQGEDVSMSESSGIPEVPGRHKITTCKDVGFFAAASTTHEAILSSCSASRASNASDSNEADDVTTGMEDQSSANLLPLKNAARVSDLFRQGTEGDSGKCQISALEGRESGISLNESLLLSVDLTSADLGTICDVNDKNYYRQMVLRSLLNGDETDQGESEARAVPDTEPVTHEDRGAGEDVQDITGENVVSSIVEAATCHELGQVCDKTDERTGKFKVVQLDCSSRDVFEDAAGSNAKNSGESLPAVNEADTTGVDELEVDSALRVVSDRVYEERDDKSISDMLPISESKTISYSVSETDLNLQRYISGDNSVPSADESKAVTREAPGRSALERACFVYRSRSEDAVRHLERNARNLKNKSVLLLETLFRAGAENSVSAAVRASLCFAAVFILLYSPSTLINILTLYLQLLVCAIFVDIFLN